MGFSLFTSQHPLHRFVKNRPRLALSFALGFLSAFSFPADWSNISRALAGWNVGVWLYLAIAGWLMISADHVRVRKIAEQEERGALAVLLIMSLAAVVSVVAVVVELADKNGLSSDQQLLNYFLTGATVLGSWSLVTVVFTFHYAFLYYRAPAGTEVLKFPEEERNPDYWDFLYFAFTIAVAAQTSDVSVCSRTMRKAVLLQSVLAFFFNAVILGFTVNIAAGVIGK